MAPQRDAIVQTVCKPILNNNKKKT